MPFTLAHPAAVLPLRRYCPRYLSFSALVVGSIVPDAGYALPFFKLEEISHQFVGSFIFCLPLGLLMMLCLYGLRLPAVNLLPERLRQIFLPLCRLPFGAPLAVIISLLIGAWLHQFWDGFTHTHGWMAEQVEWLQAPIITRGYRTFRVVNVLLYVSSFAGVAWLYFAYEQWLETRAPAALRVSRSAKVRNALLVGALVLPIEAAHHLINGIAGLVLVGAASLALLLGVVLLVGNYSQPET